MSRDKGGRGVAMLYRMETTAGSLWIRMFPRQAPMSCIKFRELCTRGFYRGKEFSAPIQGKMILLPQRDMQGDGDEEDNSMLPLAGSLGTYKNCFCFLLQDGSEEVTVIGQVWSGAERLISLDESIKIIDIKEIEPYEVPIALPSSGYPEIDEKSDYFSFAYRSPHFFSWGVSPKGTRSYAFYVLSTPLGHFPLLTSIKGKRVLWTKVLSRLLPHSSLLVMKRKRFDTPLKIALSDEGTICLHIPHDNTIVILDEKGFKVEEFKIPAQSVKGDRWELKDSHILAGSGKDRILLRQISVLDDEETRDRLMLFETEKNSFHQIHEMKYKASESAPGGFERSTYIFSQNLHYVAFLGTRNEKDDTLIITVMLFNTEEKTIRIFPDLPIKSLADCDLKTEEYALSGSISNAGDVGILFTTLHRRKPFAIWAVFDHENTMLFKSLLFEGSLHPDSTIQYFQTENLHVIGSIRKDAAQDLFIFDCSGKLLEQFTIEKPPRTQTRIFLDEKRGQLRFSMMSKVKEGERNSYHFMDRTIAISATIGSVASREELRRQKVADYAGSIETLKSLEERKRQLEHQFKYGSIGEKQYRSEMAHIKEKSGELFNSDEELPPQLPKQLRAGYIEGIISWKHYYEGMKAHNRNLVLLNREERPLYHLTIPEHYFQ
ncbi:MAG: peptidylprolyl isomerase [Candidatus Eremiobacteraeota bacterium]|nr:peptidylprolyl isomerase [Candidatus Eremiobacteraeota bacterium]